MKGSAWAGRSWACRLDRYAGSVIMAGCPGPEPSSSVDAEVIGRLQKANAALREVINTQAVQIETLTGQVTALSAQLAAQVARIEELERRLGSDSTTLLEAALVGPAVPQAGTVLLAHRLRPQARQAARRRRDDDAAGRQPERDARTATWTAAGTAGPT